MFTTPLLRCSSKDIKQIDALIIEEDDTRGYPLGIKGMGEIGSIRGPYPRARHLSPRLRVFLDWLAEQFRIGTAAG